MPQHRITCRKLLAIALIGLAALTARAADRPPNVLFIISDDLSAEALACYGNTQSRTPNIDALASRGVQFTRAYCQYPVCGPSRAALMSGLYAQTIGVTSNGHADRFTKNMGARPTMPQHFRQNDYYTARVSKIYHMRVPGDITAGVDGPDHEASWTHRFNCKAPEWMSEGEHEHLSNEKLNKDPNGHYNLGFGGAFYVVKTSTDGREQPDQMAADKAIELIAAHKNKPFFLAVGLVRPHVPLVAPKSYFNFYPFADMALPEKVTDDRADIPKAGLTGTSESRGLDTLDKQQKTLSAYYAAVAYMDAQVGRILAALDAQGLRDNTIVVFTADHGYHLGEHDLWQKMSLHEESMRIPIVIAGPGIQPARSAALAEQIDLYPTLADLAGLSLPDHLQGKSLKGVITKPDTSVRETAYGMKSGGHMLRTDRYAYITYEKSGAELYDMKTDSKQYRNLIDDPAHATALQTMRDLLDEKLKTIPMR